MSDILIFAAVKEEIELLSNQLSIEAERSIGGRRVLQGSIMGHPARLLCSGIGMTNTTQALTACIETQRPRLMIQTGCAGAYRQTGLRSGDIAVATEEIDIHLGVENVDGGALPGPLPFSLIDSPQQIAPNRFGLDSARAAYAFDLLTRYYRDTVAVKTGPFITVSTITATQTRADTYYNHYNACMEAMEGAAAAQLALLYHLPLLEIRSVSNIAGHRDHSQWNLPLAFERCCEAVLTLLKKPIP